MEKTPLQLRNEKQATEDLLPILKKYGIAEDIITAERSKYMDSELFKRAPQAAKQILLKAGFTEQQAKWCVYGIPKSLFVSETEQSVGWQHSYNCYIVEYAVDIYIRHVLMGDKRVEVGFDLSWFDKAAFINKWGLVLVYEDTQSQWSKDLQKRYDHHSGIINTLYLDKEGQVYSFSANWSKMGDGSYCGFIFNSIENAMTFVKWCIKQPKAYWKEIQVGQNGFGGFGIHSWDRELPQIEYLKDMGAFSLERDEEGPQTEQGAF